MDKKKIGALISAGILATSMVSFANNQTTTQSSNKTQISVEKQNEKNARIAKWNALSASQKNEVYAIEAEIVALQKKQIDKMVSLGVIDQTSADAKKKALDEKLAELKANSEMPRIKAGGKGGPKDRSKTNTTTQN